MAVCKACGREMTESVGCTEATFNDFADNIERPRVRYGSESFAWTSDPCHDCAAPKGEFHHPGCDVEQCPRCGGQVISCGCP